MGQQPDPAKSRAVIVGVSEYRSMNPLPTVANNTAELAALLTDDRMWGLKDAHCTVLDNPRHPGEVLDALVTAVEEATDALVFYFAGHGFLQQDSYELFLSLSGANRFRWWHALRYQDIRRILTEIPGPASKIVLLDCCFAGAAMSGMAGESEIGDELAIRGTFLMTASSSTAKALAPPGEHLTAFTGALLRAAHAGVPDGPPVVDLALLYDQVSGELAKRNRPAPQQRITDEGGKVALLHNAYYFRDRGVRGPGRPLLSDAEQSVITAPPLHVCAVLRGHHEAGDVAAADRIRQAVGLIRAEQGVAAVVQRLTGEHLTGDAEAVLRAAIRRPPDSVLVLLSALRETGQQPWADHLVTTHARHREPTGVVALARLLRAAADPSLDRLVGEALHSRAGDAARLHPMAVALVGRDLGAQPEETLRRIGAALPGDRVADLADALRAAGHETVAYRLYDTIPDLVADRPATAIARLIAGMHRSGRDRQAGDLVTRLADRHREPKQRAALLDALWNAQAPAAPAEDLNHLDEDALLATVHASYDLGQHVLSRRLMVAALAGRHPSATVRFALALRDEGLPIEAYGLIEHVRDMPADRAGAVVAGFVAADAHDYAARTVRQAFGAGLLALLPPGLRRYAEPPVLELTVPQRVELAAALPPEPRMWLLGTLPPDTDAALLGDPDVALGLVGLGGPLRARLAAAWPAGIRWPVTVIEQALSGAYGDAGTCIAYIFDLAEPAARSLLADAVAHRPAADLVALVHAAGDAVLDAVADAAGPRTQMGILSHLAEGEPAAARYLERLRAALPEPHRCALVVALTGAGLRVHAAGLLGREAGPQWRPETQIAEHVLAGLPVHPPSGRRRTRAGLAPSARVLCVLRSGTAFRSAFAVLTDTELIHVARDGTRVRVAYHRLAAVSVHPLSPTAIRVGADGRHHDLVVRVDGFADLVVRLRRDLRTFRRLVAELG